MQNFVGRSVAGARTRKAETDGTAGGEGVAAANVVATWRPKLPPGRVIDFDEKGEPIVALPAGKDGGRAVFTGRVFKMRDAVHGKEGAEIRTKRGAL